MKIETDLFPKNHQMTISRNEHRTNYESVQEYFSECGGGWKEDDILPEDLKECILKDEIWEVQWYPRTPISFYYVAAATLERCLEIINSKEWE